MSRFVRSWGVVPALLMFLGGCLPSSEGPSIPPIPTTSGSTTRVSARQPQIAKPREGRGIKGARRSMAKVQAAPKARDALLEDDAE